MTDRDRVLVINAWGDVIEGAKAETVQTRVLERRVKVTAPGYRRRYVFVDMEATTADVVMLAMDIETARGPGLQEACEKNLRAAMGAVSLRGNLVRDYFDAASGPDATKREYDRIYFGSFDGQQFARDADRTGAMRRVPSGLHDPPDDTGWSIVGSWKTTRGAPDLQVTVWRKVQGLGGGILDYVATKYVAELDMDLSTGVGHVFEALKNEITGAKTHPYDVVQMLSFYWGIIPFRLEPGE